MTGCLVLCSHSPGTASPMQTSEVTKITGDCEPLLVLLGPEEIKAVLGCLWSTASLSASSRRAIALTCKLFATIARSVDTHVQRHVKDGGAALADAYPACAHLHLWCDMDDKALAAYLGQQHAHPHPAVRHITLASLPDAFSITTELLSSVAQGFPNLQSVKVQVDAKPSLKNGFQAHLCKADVAVTLPGLRSFEFCGVEGYGTGLDAATVAGLARVQPPGSLSRLVLKQAYCESPIATLEGVAALGAGLRELMCALFQDHLTDLTEEMANAVLMQLPGLKALRLQIKVSDGEESLCSRPFMPRSLPSPPPPTWVTGLAELALPIITLDPRDAAALAPLKALRRLSVARLGQGSSEVLRTAFPAGLDFLGLAAPMAINGVPMRELTALLLPLPASPAPSGAAGAPFGMPLDKVRCYVVVERAAPEHTERLVAALARVKGEVRLGLACRQDKDWTRAANMAGRVPALTVLECVPAGHFTTQHGGASSALGGSSGIGLGACIGACSSGGDGTKYVGGRNSANNAAGAAAAPSLGNAHVRHLSRSCASLRVLRMGLAGTQLTAQGLVGLRSLSRLDRLELCGCRCGAHATSRLPGGLGPAADERHSAPVATLNRTTSAAARAATANPERLGVEGLLLMAREVCMTGAEVVYYAPSWSEAQVAEAHARAAEAGLGVRVRVERGAAQCWCTTEGQRTSGSFWALS